MNTLQFKQELNERTKEQHCLGCKVALGVNILWAISNYFIIENNKWTYVSINLVVAGIILIAMLNQKRIKISGEAIGLIPMLSTLLAFAYTYNTIEFEIFQKMTYMNLGVFVGAGMFLLWNIRYSIISIAFAIIINATFYTLYSPISLEDYMLNGGILMIIAAGFMLIAIQARYKLVKKDINSQIELEKSKRELEASEEQHRLLFEKNPTPMFICSLETKRILAVNDLVISKYGYSRHEFTQMTILDLHHEIDLADIILYSEKGINGEDTFSEWIHVLKDKSEIAVELVAKSIIYDNKAARLVSINDVTEVKQYQNELIEAKQIAENSEELQSQFLSNMSHEIRTPMNGIIGLSRILIETKLNVEQRQFVDAIIQSSENLMVIINDILDFSKIEAGKVLLDKTSFDLDKLLSTLKGIMSISANDKGLKLIIEKDADVPAWVIGDRIRMSQILTNLVSNAIKFTEHGEIKIKVSNAGTDKEDKVKLVFNIVDTGIGIPDNKIDSIFQSFTQASSSTTRTHGGTGLGLTITKQLIELQEGKIWIASELGKGSTVSFDIEYDVATNAHAIEHGLQGIEKKPNNIILQELQGVNILLVEDHPINQMLATKVLENWGLNVDLAENGQIALDMVASKNYELILMDISMPVMDGLTATKHIRSGKYSMNPDISIVAMTASALSGENQKCFDAGMNDYISKPFDPQNLLEKIYRQIQNKTKAA